MAGRSPFEERRPLPLAYVPAIHVFGSCDIGKTWMAGTRPGMTILSIVPAASWLIDTLE
jgi:hypothetical protein